jgi:hypothetical protein
VERCKWIDRLALNPLALLVALARLAIPNARIAA